MTKPGIALQLYTVRSLAHDLDVLLGAVAAAGYRAVETAGDYGQDLRSWHELLAKHDLRVVSSHVSLAALRTDLKGVIAFQTALGNRTLVVPWLAERPGNAAGWQALGSELAGLAQRCREHGLTLLYHNHDFEMVEIEGRLALDWLLEGAALGLEPDLAWMVRGGRDPLALLKRFAGRCPRAHLKDIAPEGHNLDQDGWADVGYGLMDWPALIPATIAAGAEWLIVEHDKPLDPLLTVRRSYRWLTDYLARL
ncbi:MAG: sugar phosphate isomerase/epimerase [Truepera sp.]|nr:sugar phosphate isomerase/epimerase [Truepera sp.]